MSYIGDKPSQTLASPTSQYFNGTGSQTVFTLNRLVNVSEDLEVFVNNIQQEPGVGKSYTATGSTLTFDAAPSAGTANVYVVYRGLAEVTTRLEHDPNAALAATTGTFSGDLTVDTNTLYVDSTNNRVGIGTASPTQIVDIAHSGSQVAGAVRIGDPSAISSNTGIYMRTTGLATIGAAGGKIVFDTNFGSSEKVRIDSDGMKFNGDTAAANALDDYEEGTFTPQLYHTSSNNSTFSSVNGNYTKIGNTVTCQIRIDGGNSGTAGSFLVLDGMPFAVNSAQSNQTIGIWGSNPNQQVGNIHGFNPPRLFKGGQDITTQMSFFTAMLVYKTDS